MFTGGGVLVTFLDLSNQLGLVVNPQVLVLYQNTDGDVGESIGLMWTNSVDTKSKDQESPPHLCKSRCKSCKIESDTTGMEGEPPTMRTMISSKL